MFADVANVRDHSILAVVLVGVNNNIDPTYEYNL